MKVLVTGGAGFIGSHVVDAYVEAGHEVVVIDNLRTGRRENVNPKARFYLCDLTQGSGVDDRRPTSDIRHPTSSGSRLTSDIRHLTSLSEVFATERPEIVNHHAAQTSVTFSLKNPAFDAWNNVIGGVNLLECCMKYGVRKVIYASTGGAIYGEPEYSPCDENHPARPLCPYGITKFVVEKYLHYYSQVHGLRYVILRYANVYGPRQDPFGEAGVVAIFVGKMLNAKCEMLNTKSEERTMDDGPQTIDQGRGNAKREMLNANSAGPVINGSGEQTRDFVYVADVAEANVKALEMLNAKCEMRNAKSAAPFVVNIGSGGETSVDEVFTQIARATGYDGAAVHGPSIPGEVFRIALNVTRARAVLQWEPKVGFDEGIRRTVEWFRGKADC